MRAVGAITLGQAPRDDVVPEIQRLLGPDIRLVEAGALDGLTRPEVAALAPANPVEALVTRLADGTEVLVGKSALVPRLQACVDRLAASTDASVILCAGAFPPFRSPRPVLLPERLIGAAVDAVWDGGRLGVIVPVPEQQDGTRARWARIDREAAVVVASPYHDTTPLVAAAEALRRAGVTLTVMSCLGFTSAHKAVVRDVTRAPALLPASIIARFLAELA